MSPKQRRTAALKRRFPSWYLTDGKTSKALHIGAAFWGLEWIAKARRAWPTLKPEEKPRWRRMIAAEVRSSQFNLSIGKRVLP